MKQIANIVYDKTIDETGIYNMCDESSIIPGIPTLIVGWKNVKKIYPNKSIIGWEIDDNTYWTFGKREKREQYEKDIVKFKKLCIKKIINSIKYRFIDILTMPLEDKEILNDNLFSDCEKYIYRYEDMVYVYNECSNEVIGINLSDVEYEGKSEERIISLFKKNPNNHFIESVDEVMVNKNFRNNIYVIPYIYS